VTGPPPPTRPSSADKQPAFSPSFMPPQEHHGNRRRGNLLSEDWGHLDMVKIAHCCCCCCCCCCWWNYML